MDEISHQFEKILNENKKEQWWHGVGSGTVLKMQDQKEREIRLALQAKEARIAEDLNQELQQAEEEFRKHEANQQKERAAERKRKHEIKQVADAAAETVQQKIAEREARCKVFEATAKAAR